MRQGIKAEMTGNVVSIEKIKQVGRGRDAQHVLNFRVASNHYAPAGTPQEEVGASFVNVSLWNQRAITLAQYIRKGMPIKVLGYLELKQVESTKAPGVNVTFADLRANDFEFVGGGRKRQDGDEQAEQAAPQAAPAAAEEEQVEAAPAPARTSKRASRGGSPRRKSTKTGGAADVPTEVLASESTGGGEAAPSDEKPF